MTIDNFITKLGEGTVISLDSSEMAFKLASFKNNPIVKPQYLGLIWCENGELKIGAVFG